MFFIIFYENRMKKNFQTEIDINKQNLSLLILVSKNAIIFVFY